MSTEQTTIICDGPCCASRNLCPLTSIRSLGSAVTAGR